MQWDTVDNLFLEGRRLVQVESITNKDTNKCEVRSWDDSAVSTNTTSLQTNLAFVCSPCLPQQNLSPRYK